MNKEIKNEIICRDNDYPLVIKNKEKGNKAEQIIQELYRNRGYTVIPTAIGSDFIAINNINSHNYKEYIEVKTGYSRITKKQKQTRKKVLQNGHNYTIHYLSDDFLEFIDGDELL